MWDILNRWVLNLYGCPNSTFNQGKNAQYILVVTQVILAFILMDLCMYLTLIKLSKWCMSVCKTHTSNHMCCSCDNEHTQRGIGSMFCHELKRTNHFMCGSQHNHPGCDHATYDIIILLISIIRLLIDTYVVKQGMSRG